VNRTFVKMAGRRFLLSNLEKDLYPSYGFTKARILEYYRSVALFILPYLRDRPVTLKRYPDGVEKDFFFEKRCPEHHPDWVKTAQISRDDENPIKYCLINDLETLIWVENLASLELHVSLARAEYPQTPDSMVFDLDPGDSASILDCSRIALILHDLLFQIGLMSYVKTSGRKGLHVYVPLNNKETTFEETKKFSKTVAGIMQKHYPDLVTSKMAKPERKGKVFINWSQNDASKTMICVYSLRAQEKPFVSFPLGWRELENLYDQHEVQKFQIVHSEALSRIARLGDLFEEVLVKEQKLPHL
jgi:bifunctional non-homologous end joining protein LigD